METGDIFSVKVDNMAGTFVPKSAREITAKNCDSVTTIGFLTNSELNLLIGNKWLPRRFKDRVRSELQSRWDNDAAELRHNVQ